ncbi:MAG: Cell division trigger factor [Ktedonobacterales bacterium]|nr:MAG: Cell division trigger factor [Ktedonobacterales bacterium]
MKITIERPSNTEAVVNVELEWVELEKASDRAYQRLAQRYDVPGFRKGHAPRTLLERRLGKETIYQEGLEDLIESSYRDAVRQNNLQPLAQPELDAPTLELGQPYTFVARVPVIPPVELGDYKAIRVAQPKVEITDEDIAKVVEQVREDHAMWLPVERPAEIGDQVIVDLKLTANDRDISNLTDNEFVLVEERPGIFSGMDQQLVGMSEGESKEFTTTIPEDYANAELAGKEASYTVTLKGVKNRELPEADDELAKSVGEYENMDGLREAIREQLQRQKENEARREVRESVLKAVTDQVEIEIPHVLVHNETDEMIDEMQRILAQNRLSFEQYLSMMSKSEEEYRQEIEPEATGRAKRELVLNAVADAEGIEPTTRDLEQWLELMALVGGGKRVRLRDLSAGQRASITRRLARDLATDRLVEIATQEGEAEAEGAPAAEAEAATDTKAEATPAPKPATKSRAKAKATTEAKAEAAGASEAESAAEAESES